MINFKTPQIEDLPALRAITEKYGTMGCDFNPVNIYIWRNRYNIKICVRDGFLLLAYFRNNIPWGYSFPVGDGDLKDIIDEIYLDAAARGCKAHFVMLTEAQREKLVELTGFEYTFEELTGDEDYIYTNYDLCLLPGKKYHSKRNHISKFNRSYPNWKFTIISGNNKADALAVAEKWCENNGYDISTYEEYAAIKETLDNYEALKMHGGVLYVGDAPVAMTIGSRIDRTTFDVVFEKALVEYDGSYAKVNNEFAKTLIGFEFINREEDMGLESLRKSKLSYHPVAVLKRYIGVKND